VELKCVQPYKNDARGLAYQVGDVERDPRLVQFLRTDSPGSFEVVEGKPTRKAVRRPAKNKAVQAAPEDK